MTTGTLKTSATRNTPHTLTSHLTAMLCEAYEAQDCATNPEQARLLQALAKYVRDAGAEIVETQ